MPHDSKPTPKTISGEVADIFAHRFVVLTKDGPVLADLGPKGAELVTLKRGDTVELVGEQKPSELKVERFTSGGKIIEIKPRQDDRADSETADPKAAIAAVQSLGRTVLGEPRRKPKHFEILAKDAAGQHHEHHVEFDGAIRKSKPVGAHDEKWAEALKSAA